MHTPRSVATGLAAMLWIAVSACSAPQEPTSSVQFAASVQQALSAQDVTRVTVTVSAVDMPPRLVELAKSNGVWGGLIGQLPAGLDRSFRAEAFDASGTLRFQGQTSGVTLLANQTTFVAITLQEVPAPTPYGNEAPIIDSTILSAVSVQTGGTISLSATAHDPNPGDTLTFAWTGSGGAFSAPTATSTSWTAPASVGVQILTLTVTDSQGASSSLALTINVISRVVTGDAAVNITFNFWPVVSKVAASLNRLQVGQATAVSALASDADGEALSYQWTATCAGTWTNATSSTATFVPTALPAGACNNCLLTVSVQDGRGGKTTGSINLCVASASTQPFPPLITQYYQSALSTAPGQTVTFDVTAMDPQASALSFSWSATAGSLGTADTHAATSRVTWTAPACASARTSTITATVTNAFSQAVTRDVTVTGLPACSVWTPVGSLAEPHFLHTATRLADGRVLLAGGSDDHGALATAGVYDPAASTWSATGAMALSRFNHMMVLLPNGKVLVAGGEHNGGYLATAEVYDPTSGTWSATGAMSSPRSNPVATLLSNGKVLVSGGTDVRGVLATAEVYDPASGTWSATNPMATARTDHTATRLSNGKVLVSGGNTARAELYDPVSGTWSATGAMAASRYAHTATRLPDGKVLVAGGNSRGVFLVESELYDPATGTWSETQPMSSPRTYHSATELPNGKVLVAGGDSGEGYLASVEVYDPATGTWSTVGSMASSRFVHTATLLLDGKVLVSGGYNGSVLAGVELYTP